MDTPEAYLERIESLESDVRAEKARPSLFCLATNLLVFSYALFYGVYFACR